MEVIHALSFALGLSAVIVGSLTIAAGDIGASILGMIIFFAGIGLLVI